MRAVTAAWRNLIPYSHTVISRVDSYRGGVLLASDIPITAGVMHFDDTGTLRRRLNISVPARDGLTRWDPGNNVLAPLNAYGQRLRVHTGIGYPGGTPEVVDLGETLITSWARNEPDATIEVEAIDLAQLVSDAAFTGPTTPVAGNTFYQEFQRLIAPTGIPVAPIDAGLVDRLLPTASVVYEDEREAAVNELVAAWPARWFIGDDGRAHVAPPYGAVSQASPVVLTLRDGSTGTVTGRGRRAQRGAIVNTVVIDGKANEATGAAPHSVARITDANSPIYPSGPYGAVVRKLQSDMIATQGEADAVSTAQLRRLSTVGRSEQLACVPDASIELGDIGSAYTMDGDRWVGRIATIDLPLTAEGGVMVVGLTNEPGVNP